MITDTNRNNIISHLLRSLVWSKPTPFAVALFTTTPAADGTGGVEVVGPTPSNYSRITYGANDSNWSDPDGYGYTTNSNTITFNDPEDDWGTITAVALMTASTGGNVFAFYELPNAKTVNNGDDPLVFAPGSIILTVS
jgi:hypothetical protein